ncbi:hypothetical protein PMAYCL1PPCAC_09680, partial [Pristionchus mayeri]
MTLVELIAKDVVDATFLFGQTYLIILLILSKNTFFRSPFFYFFIWTGICGNISTIGYILTVRFPLPLERAWVFKTGYMLSSFGVTGATLGKLFIVIHRYVVI